MRNMSYFKQDALNI